MLAVKLRASPLRMSGSLPDAYDRAEGFAVAAVYQAAGAEG